MQSVLDWATRRYIPSGYAKNSNQFLQSGDILVSTANSKALVGKSCLVTKIPEPCVFGAFVTVLRPAQDVSASWLMFALQLDEAKDYFYTSSSNTTNISNLKTVDLLDLPIPLPPLAEQKRIVSILTEQLAAVERAKKAAEERLEAAWALRWAVLMTVWPLTEEIPTAWKWVSLSKVSTIDYGYTASADFTSQGPKFLRITDIQNGNVEWEQVPSCLIDESNEKKKRLGDGDIVFARTGGTTGKSFLVKNPPRAVFASYLLRVRADNVVEPNYPKALL